MKFDKLVLLRGDGQICQLLREIQHAGLYPERRLKTFIEDGANLCISFGILPPKRLRRRLQGMRE